MDVTRGRDELHYDYRSTSRCSFGRLRNFAVDLQKLCRDARSMTPGSAQWSGNLVHCCFCTRRRPSERVRNVAKNTILRIISTFRFRNAPMRICCIRSCEWHSPASNATSQSRCLSIPVVKCIVTLVLPIMGVHSTLSVGVFTAAPVAPGYGRSGRRV